ncbi:MAG: hypothetical protein ACRD4K_14590, partial [Candidatus Acidiferrales bacterium]
MRISLPGGRSILFGPGLAAILAAMSPVGPQAQRQLPPVQFNPPTQEQKDAASARPVFEFHSGFWVNLHHVLYEQARLRQEKPTNRGGGTSAPGAAANRERKDATSADWNAAVNFYISEMGDRDLLFDTRMIEINTRLAQLEACEDLSGRSDPDCSSNLDHDLVQSLERAAPVYRERWWPEDDRANRAWIATIAPLVRQIGKPLADKLSEVYRSQWPRNSILVDVSVYGGPLGAYTTLDPLHITISSTDIRNQGLAGFEILFHESSHALAGSVQQQIIRDCRAANKPIPRDLWHALLFYTTGALVKQVLQRSAAPGSSGYTP